MSGLLKGGPLVVLREERGGPPKARVDRIREYLRERDARRQRAEWWEKRAGDAEARRVVPCALCGGQTSPWDRRGLPPDLVICGKHSRGMCGYFPFRRNRFDADIPEEVNRLLMPARLALYAFERLAKTMEASHGRYSH